MQYLYNCLTVYLNCGCFLTTFTNFIVVCVMYVKQFASEEWREARFHFLTNIM